jgi:hypothetical protein
MANIKDTVKSRALRSAEDVIEKEAARQARLMKERSELMKEENDLLEERINDETKRQRGQEALDRRREAANKRREAADKREERAAEKSADASEAEADIRSRSNDDLKDLFKEERETRRRALKEWSDEGARRVTGRAKDLGGSNRSESSTIVDGLIKAAGSIAGPVIGAAVAAFTKNPVWAAAGASGARIATEGALRIANDASSVLRKMALDNKRFMTFGNQGNDRATKTRDQARREATEEITQMSETLAEAGRVAAYFATSSEDLRAAAIKIANSTGENFGKNFYGDNGILATISRLESMGMGTAETLASTYEELSRSGKSSADALAEMNEVAMSALDASGTEGFAVSMSEIFTRVENVTRETGSLSNSFTNLSKVMSGGVKLAKKMGLSLSQSLKGAEALVSALTVSYDEGFGTVNVERDIALAMSQASDQQKRQLATIQKGLATGALTPDLAARQMKELGLDQIGPVLERRLADLIENPQLAQQGAMAGKLPAELSHMLINARDSGQSAMDAAREILSSNKDAVTSAFALRADAMREKRTSVSQAEEAQIDAAVYAAADGLNRVSTPAAAAADKLSLLGSRLSEFDAALYEATTVIKTSHDSLIKQMVAPSQGGIQLFRDQQGKLTSIDDLRKKSVDPAETAASREAAKKVLNDISEASTADSMGKSIEDFRSRTGIARPAVPLYPPMSAPKVSTNGDVTVTITLPGSALQQSASTANAAAASTSPTK